MKNFLSGSKMFRFVMMFLIPVVFLLHPWVAFPEELVENALAKEDELDDELKYLKEETYVITPSKIPQRIEKAPGTVYVVTERQIRQMGARYLREVIETVPGWYVWQMWRGEMVYARNAAGSMSSMILFMVNSHQVNDAYYGSATETYANLDLDNVKRIEFVSGPGSSLYGSGAMAGVINIITKDGNDVDGLQLTARGGSFDTFEGSALFGKNINGLDVAAYVDYRTTDGFRGHVDRDRQSVLDERFGTHASLAPGSTKGDEYDWDAQLTVKYAGFKFDGKFIDRKRDLPFSFTSPTLDNSSNWHNKEYYLNFSYDVTPTEGLDLMVKAYRNQNSMDMRNQTFPKGSLMMTPSGPTINSVNRVTEVTNKNSRMGAEAQVVYEIVDSNTIVGGITFEQQKSYDNKAIGNVYAVSFPFVYMPLPSVQDLPAGRSVPPDEERNVYAAYVEDIWDILDNLRLTVGGRYDYYTGSGGQFSPRLGINWEFYQDYYTKFLYGRAFRVPYFLDLSNPAFGNPDLKNETQDTFELSFGANLLPFSGQVTVFHIQFKDSINVDVSGNPPTYKYMNGEKYTRHGVELQMKYDFGRGSYLGMNYTHQNTDYPTDSNVVGWMKPERLGTLTGNIRLNKYLNLNAYLLYRGGWVRNPNDTRDDPGDYVIANTTLIAKNFIEELEGLELRGSVYNLFNKEYTSPTGPGELPDDYSMPGINFMLELRYAF